MTEYVQQQSARKKPRSPAYPAIDLPEALQKAEIIRVAEGKNATNVETALEHWGYSAKSGPGKAALSALIKHGLLEDEGKGDERRVNLTPLAMTILLDDRPESVERLHAIREAALLPTIYGEVWRKYQGALPSDPTLRYYLRHDRNFLDDAAGECIKNLRSSLAYARLPESDHVSSEVADMSDQVSHTSEDLQWSDEEPSLAPPSTVIQRRQPAPEAADETATMRTLQIPLTDAPWATIQIPYPMTAQDWEELRAWLDSNASPLTKGAVKPMRNPLN